MGKKDFGKVGKWDLGKRGFDFGKVEKWEFWILRRCDFGEVGFWHEKLVKGSLAYAA